MSEITFTKSSPILTPGVIKIINIILTTVLVLSISVVVMFFLLPHPVNLLLPVGTAGAMLTSFGIVALFIFSTLSKGEPLQIIKMVPFFLLIGIQVELEELWEHTIIIRNLKSLWMMRLKTTLEPIWSHP